MTLLGLMLLLTNIIWRDIIHHAACHLPVALKAMNPEDGTVCIEFWLNRYQGIIGSFLSFTAAVVAAGIAWRAYNVQSRETRAALLTARASNIRSASITAAQLNADVLNYTVWDFAATLSSGVPFEQVAANISDRSRQLALALNRVYEVQTRLVTAQVEPADQAAWIVYQNILNRRVSILQQSIKIILSPIPDTIEKTARQAERKKRVREQGVSMEAVTAEMLKAFQDVMEMFSRLEGKVETERMALYR